MSKLVRTSLMLVTPPTQEPVTVAEFKDHQRISHSDEDQRIGNLITAARRWCENYLSMAFVTQTWRQSMDCFPRASNSASDYLYSTSEIRVGRPPLASVSSLTYANSTGGTTTMPSSDYRVDTDAKPGRITPIYGGTWPTGIREQSAAVTVNLVAGFSSSTPESVSLTPATIKQAILMLAASWYENREAVTEVGLVEAPLGVVALLDSESVGQYV